MEFLSVISKGTVRDKLMWTFTFYDVDHDGVISKEEMLKVSVFLEMLFLSIENQKLRPKQLRQSLD